MSPKVKSTGRTLRYKGFEVYAESLDYGKRIKLCRLRGPKGTEITDEMMDAGVETAQEHPDIRSIRRTQSGSVIAAPKKFRSVSKVLKLVEQLKHEVFRLIVEAMIAVRRQAKRKLRQAKAAQEQKPARFVNDKTRTSPSPVQVT